MTPSDNVARALAATFLSGPLEVEGLVQRGGRLLGRRGRWLRPLARRLCSSFAARPRPRHVELVGFILADPGFQRALEHDEPSLVDRLEPHPPTMVPAAAARAWLLPPIHTPGELADWLGITPRDLDWFAGRRSPATKHRDVRRWHYHYRPTPKRFGQVRLIEAPKQRLKAIQRQILRGILEAVPPHPAAHGFRRGRSIKSFAACHAGKRVVLRIDLQNFFPSISAARVAASFRTIGYPERVADLLASLCSNTAPAEAWPFDEPVSREVEARDARRLYQRPHLPQGAPTSPALANLAAWRLDRRLAGLAQAADADYTRYADDLAFSGQRDFERRVQRFHLHACAIALEEGFDVHHRKTRIMRQGVTQRLAGVVVNEHPNVARHDYDRLKATLINCLRHGPDTQNRAGHADFRAHLQGRVAQVEMINPPRGQRLRLLLQRIAW